jgi:hypothetical protein
MSRLPTRLLVSALLRRVNDAGGFAVVRARGDETAGAVLAITDDVLLERGLDSRGESALIESVPKSGESVDDYWARRRRSDPDLWVIELDIAQAKRLIAETFLQD